VVAVKPHRQRSYRRCCGGPTTAIHRSHIAGQIATSPAPMCLSVEHSCASRPHGWPAAGQFRVSTRASPTQSRATLPFWRLVRDMVRAGCRLLPFWPALRATRRARYGACFRHALWVPILSAALSALAPPIDVSYPISDSQTPTRR
jgi:hypothetical protein